MDIISNIGGIIAWLYFYKDGFGIKLPRKVDMSFKTKKQDQIICSQLYSFKYSFLILMIYTQLWVECSPVVRETWVQSQVASYLRFLKYLTLSNIRYVSRVKWSNSGKRVAPSPTSWCSSYWKRSLLVALDYGHQVYFTYMV